MPAAQHTTLQTLQQSKHNLAVAEPLAGISGVSGGVGGGVSEGVSADALLARRRN